MNTDLLSCSSDPYSGDPLDSGVYAPSTAALLLLSAPPPDHSALIPAAPPNPAPKLCTAPLSATATRDSPDGPTLVSPSKESPSSYSSSRLYGCNSGFGGGIGIGMGLPDPHTGQACSMEETVAPPHSVQAGASGGQEDAAGGQREDSVTEWRKKRWRGHFHLTIEK